MVAAFHRLGWHCFAADAATRAWAEAALPLAQKGISDPELRARWLVCQGTWFVGVDALDNTPDGSVAGVSLAQAVTRFLADGCGPARPLHRAQVSVVWPGYPRPREGESAAAFAYRQNRDAAHVDGLHAVGPDRRRVLHEAHAYILGLPLTATSGGASPLVVWEGSHEVMRQAFRAALTGVPEADWPQVDLTETYQAARREVFDTCPRRVIEAGPGEAYVIHRLALHGVAPWADGARAPEEGRIVAYFRPEVADGWRDWLERP